MSDFTQQLRERLAEDSPHRMAYFETTLNRIASEVSGNAKFHGERTAAIMDEIDGLRKDLKTLTERVNRMAEFLTELKKNGASK